MLQLKDTDWLNGYKPKTHIHVAVQFFQAPLTEKGIFAPLYILALFIKNKVPISVWVYLWAVCLVPLVYIVFIMLR